MILEIKTLGEAKKKKKFTTSLLVTEGLVHFLYRKLELKINGKIVTAILPPVHADSHDLPIKLQYAIIIDSNYVKIRKMYFMYHVYLYFYISKIVKINKRIIVVDIYLIMYYTLNCAFLKIGAFMLAVLIRRRYLYGIEKDLHKILRLR